MLHRGRIIKGVGGLYTVKTEEDRIDCRARGVFRKENFTPLVGDYVEVENGVIVTVLPRKNSLIRPACSNLDKLILVTALSSPDPNVYHLDKMMTIAAYHGIEPILVFNKTDLPDVCSIRSIYRSLPIKQFDLCAKNGLVEQTEGLKKEIDGCTVAFSGVSGVGKSTIVNLLDPNREQETGTVSEKLGRGRHTTRCVELFDLCGGHVMDTPGFSNLLFKFFDVTDKTKVQTCFPEFAEYLGKCRFSDCLHGKEPDCAVTQAVAEGKIPESRYRSYLMMLEEISAEKEW